MLKLSDRGSRVCDLEPLSWLHGLSLLRQHRQNRIHCRKLLGLAKTLFRTAVLGRTPNSYRVLALSKSIWTSEAEGSSFKLALIWLPYGSRVGPNILRHSPYPPLRHNTISLYSMQRFRVSCEYIINPLQSWGLTSDSPESSSYLPPTQLICPQNSRTLS